MPLSEGYLTAKLAALRASYSHAGDFCFFTDVMNLPAIIASGQMLPRAVTHASGVITVNCASASVLSGTPDWVGQCVRLYFAPKTPMLYRVEGIKRAADDWPECPRPAYLVFDPRILTLEGVAVSDGNMGSGASVAQAASDAFFDDLPFGEIYHRGAYDSQTSQIGRRRHAEVLVRDRLPLNWLRRLVFRSDAERDLALRITGGFPAHVQTVVDTSWFFANQRGMPYMQTAVRDSAGTVNFTVRNLREGDKVVHLSNPTAGKVRASSTTYTSGKFGDWAPEDYSELGLEVPSEGVRRLYLYGHLVGEFET